MTHEIIYFYSMLQICVCCKRVCVRVRVPNVSKLRELCSKNCYKDYCYCTVYKVAESNIEVNGMYSCVHNFIDGFVLYAHTHF